MSFKDGKGVDSGSLRLLGVEVVETPSRMSNSEATYQRYKVGKSTHNTNIQYHIVGNLKCSLSQYDADHHFPDNMKYYCYEYVYNKHPLPNLGNNRVHFT